MTPARADLHTHTVFSDGSYTPEALVRLARDAGLGAIAITDHDSVAGIEPALAAGSAAGIEVIPAIELSAEYEGRELHILGYFLDHTSPRLTAALRELVHNRIERVHAMVGKLRDLDVDLSAEAVFEFARGAPPGRLHVAQALLKKGYIASLPEAFNKYIGDRSPAYVCGFKFSPREAIDLLRGCGGVAVLAHPYLIRNDALIPELAGYGLSGLEVYYPEHSQSVINFYLELARRLGLAATGGSDFHGHAKPDVPLGIITIPYELVDALRKKKP